MSNKKKGRRDGTIPMKNKNVATPVNSNNISNAFYEYTKKEDLDRNSKTNRFL